MSGTDATGGIARSGAWLAMLAGMLCLQAAVVAPPAVAAAGGRPDLDVTHIERTPRYHRYVVQYVDKRPDMPWGLPRLCPSNVDRKRWPSPGEAVTYTAHIRNAGDAASPAIRGQWLVDGAVVRQTRLPALAPGGEVAVALTRAWSDASQSIRFRADPRDRLREVSEANNDRTIGSLDLTLSIWVERGLYELFAGTTNLVGSRSFEDWIQAQIAAMNDRLSISRYTQVAPEGALDRVRVEKIVVMEELDGRAGPPDECSPEPLDPGQFRIDGRWFFTDFDPTNAAGNAGVYQQYVDLFATTVDWGLVHELAHQIGIVDLYRMNLRNDPPANNGVHVLDRSGAEIPTSFLPNYAWDQIMFLYPGIMVGGDTRPYIDDHEHYFESHTVAGLNRHARLRRGFFGEYLWDTPRRTYLYLVDEQGLPVAGARVRLYQKDGVTEDIDNTPEIVVTTGPEGRVRLPNRPVVAASTVTGHTLRPNPFGQISFIGQNGTMLVRATRDGRDLFGWLMVHDLNLAFWAGHEDATFCKLTLSPLRANATQSGVTPSRRARPCAGWSVTR